MRTRFLAFLLSMLLLACEDAEHTPLVHSDAIPGALSNINVENLPGAAKISYAIPDDPNILYIQAEYTLPSGEAKVVKSSVSKNFVLIEGFNNTDERDVKLFTVSRSEVSSNSPSNVRISPLTAPIQHTFASLNVFETFGGVAVELLNESQASYVVHTMYKDWESDNWVPYDRFYITNAKDVRYAVRGFTPEPKEFAFYVVDKWKNHSDTLFRNLTPVYEEEMDKSLWSNAALLDDYYQPRYANNPLSMLWTPGGTTYFLMRNNDPELKLPNWFTIDLGRAYKFGRMKVNHLSHSDNWQFSLGTPRVFEIWASNVKSTNWDDWTLLGEFESVKPSGLPIGQLSDDDRALNAAGEDYDFDPLDQSFRYIRFKTIQTWGGTPDVSLLELTFWGQAN